MDSHRLARLLHAVSEGRVSPQEAVERLRSLPFEDLGYAVLDMHRELRSGMPEVVYCQGKTAEQAAAILKRLWQGHDRVMGTRASAEQAAAIRREIPESRYDPVSRIITLARGDPPALRDGRFVLVAAAGTADLPVAEEAAQTAEFLGSGVERAYDVGVAGLHRLLDRLPQLRQAAVVISVAGMEGALTSVIGGLVGCPVIGVPTQVGYGASFGGLAALLAMLNSCASGVTVVNIDNGFGAAVAAHRMLAAARRSAATP
jgi:NCAIR mutase (PurE)-related protein